MLAYGIDIGGTTIKGGALQDENIVSKKEISSPRDPQEMTAAVIGLLYDLGWDGKAPVGVDCAGGVSSDGLVYADNLGWQKGVPLGKLLHEQGCNAKVLNDASAALLAEWKLGALRGVEHGLLITFGTGIGSGVIANGQPYDGRDGFGIELGHIITHIHGEHCTCGQDGCWELYASAGALSRFCGGLSPKVIFGRLSAGENVPGFERYTDEVAVGVVSCLSAYAPEVIAFGGGLSNAGPLFLNGIMDALHKTPGFARMYSKVSYRLAQTGNDAGIIGSALYALE